MERFVLTASKLPPTLPIFPLAGVLLLPGGELPLNVFEARYLNMVDDAMREERLIGIVQPENVQAAKAVHDIGCAGKITSLSESGDGRYFITLTGMCRFRITGELPSLRGYRRVSTDWDDFLDDLTPNGEVPNIDRDRLNRLLKSYFKAQGLSCDWQKMEGAPDRDLLTALAMICPLEPMEKQALLEATNIKLRTDLFMHMIEMAICETHAKPLKH